VENTVLTRNQIYLIDNSKDAMIMLKDGSTIVLSEEVDEGGFVFTIQGSFVLSRCFFAAQAYLF
jgi:hypothetical protein